MADVTINPADTTRAVATAPNYTTGLTATSSSNAYYIPNNGKVLLIIAAGTTASVTIETPRTGPDGLAITDLVLTLADNNLRIHGPFPTDNYNNAAGQLKLTVSAATTLFAVRMP